MKKSWKHWLLAGVAAQCLLVYSTTFAADKVVVIPLGTSRTAAKYPCIIILTFQSLILDWT